MMRKNRSLAILVGVISALCSCKDKYLPNVKENTVSYLVVEGLINTGTDSTIFNLTRTFKLDNKAVVSPEKGAIVQVENEAGTVYLLPETVKGGKYGRPSLGLDGTKKYRLRIRTKDNKQYLSDFTQSKTSPPIDNITYDFRNDMLNIYANTHDPAGNSRYYNFSYDETWEYRSPLYTPFKVVNHEILIRNLQKEDVSRCWHNTPSSTINLKSTVGLSEDRVSDKALLSIAPNSEKIGFEYSVLVKQTVLTKEAFEFWESLRRNTEQVGDIFDVQPSQLFGNISCITNPAEVVIGFVSAGTVSQQRLLLLSKDLPNNFRGPVYDLACENSVADVLFHAADRTNQVLDLILYPSTPFAYPITEISDGGDLKGYKAVSQLSCIDCTTAGGTITKPSYWK